MGLKETIGRFAASLTPAPARIYNLGGSGAALFLSLQREPFLMVEAGEGAARRLKADIEFYRRVLALEAPPVYYLPPPDGAESSGLRADAVQRAFSGGGPASAITTSDALGHPLWRPDELRRVALHVEAGDEMHRESIEERLLALGYARMPIVTEKGQFSRRGFILDVFPTTWDNPVRVEFFGDEVESIREFDVDTQRSMKELKAVGLVPAVEPVEGVEVASLSEGLAAYCSDAAGEEAAEGRVVLSRYAIKGEGADAGLLSLAGHGVLAGERKDMAALPHAVKGLSAEHRVALVSPSTGQAERLREVFHEEDVDCPLIEPGEILGYGGRVSISVGPLSSGIFLPGLAVLTEHEIFGERPAYRAERKSKVSRLLATIEDFVEGDFIVHRDRGIGRFLGLVRQSVEDAEYDMVAMEYAGGDRLYIPLHAIDLIRKYRAEEGVAPRLERLGSATWQKTRERVAKRVREMAEKLLRLYAEREVAEGTAFSPDTEMHREFDSFFLYEETPDQLAAIEEIKRDMESPLPMDRLLAGDVGYGKTEVAMRAAFKAVYDGRQVAVLVPTTLLCEQHLRIFKSRFSAFPVRVDHLSRFKTKKERDETLKAAERGEVDIVIATHSLLRPDLKFKALGLLIVDEEHRFGVRQKEHIKGLKRGVDVLSLSATPIPRTLQMSLSGIRKMSLINTPPEERIAVRTEVAVSDDGLIRQAVEKELARGGQVFFVHNRIQDMEKVARRLRDLLPLARVAVAHGQMGERELEKVMLAFLNMEVDVLLCTAIIGSGLDIPTANTIIIDMAHRMGLADLYQLKGRVGRGNVKAYAYCLVPKDASLTEQAAKRLQAVQELSYMGAGFRLAMKDLEIRGAGNLLGAQQSGNIEAVGFDMYMEMLEEAVAELRGTEVKKRAAPSINMKVNAFIPEDYIDDPTLRLSAYREIAGATALEGLKEIEAEMSDRFGPPPAAFLDLLRVMGLKVRAAGLLIKDITRLGRDVRLTFEADSGITAEAALAGLGPGVRFFKDGIYIAAEGDALGCAAAALDALRAAQPVNSKQ